MKQEKMKCLKFKMTTKIVLKNNFNNVNLKSNKVKIQNFQKLITN